MLSVALASTLALAAATGTKFLDHDALLSSVEDPQWFERNVPLLDIPEQSIQDVYYYRWQTYREHLVYTGAQYGYLSSEFLHPVGYGAPYGGVVAAAGFHVTESRWIRDTCYGHNVLNYWLAGPGQFSKPATEELNKDTYDWAHEYSAWFGNAAWKQYLVTGDKDFVVGQLENLVKQYRGWDNHFNSKLGLYWQVPVWDATEYTAASYESADPYHGGAGYRPTINSYQYGDARAIAAIAALKGDRKLEKEYNKRADALQEAVQRQLWDHKSSFFKHMARDNNTSDQLLKDREIMGYIPWAFNLPTKRSTLAAFSQLNDPEGFSAKFGPTTLERRSRWFMHEAENCCRWDGPSWPYATAQTLTAVETLLHDYPSQRYISSQDYFDMLKTFAATQHKDGKPYVAEAHAPDNETWIYDGEDHSEDYNHSSFIDNVLAGLIGVRAQAGDTLVVNPLTPSSWDYFAVENIAYHGHSVTIVWDKGGKHYGRGSGLRIYVDGRLAGSRKSLGSLKVHIRGMAVTPGAWKVNIAANGQLYQQLTTAFASYTFAVDNASRVIDGIVWRTGIPENSRWTSYSSSNGEDHVGLDFGRNQSLSDVRLYFYDDGDGVQIPTKFDLQYWTGSNWRDIPRQSRSPLPKSSNVETTISFPSIKTSKVRVLAPNKGDGTGWGLSEFEVWAEPIFQIRNENSQKFMGVGNASKSEGASIFQQDSDDSHNQLWKFLQAPGGWYKIQNMQSELLLAVKGASRAEEAELQQHDNNGGDEQLWRVDSHGDGSFIIRNKNSGKVVDVLHASTSDGANLVQVGEDESKSLFWDLLPAVP